MENMPQNAREIIETIPERFIPERAKDMEAIIHMDISGENGGQFTVLVKDGICKLESGLNHEPTSFLGGKDTDFEDVEFGRTNPAMAIMMGKAKTKNLNELLRFKGCFDPLKPE